MTRRTRIAISVLLAGIALRIALPFGIQAILERQASAALGRPVVVENVSLTLSRGAASLEGIRVGTEDSPILRCSRVSANLDVLGVLLGKIGLESLEIVNPEIVVRLLSDGTLEPLILATQPPAIDETDEVPAEATSTPSVEDEADAAEEGSALPLHVDQLMLENLSILLVPSGGAKGNPAELGLGRLTLRDFSIGDGKLDFGSIGLESPRVKVRRDIVIAPASEPETRPETEPAEERQTSGTGLDVSGTDFTIDDAKFVIQAGEEELTFVVDLSVREVDFGPGERFPVRLRVERESGWLEFNGEAGVQPVALQGNLALEGVSLVSVLHVANPEIAARIEKGILGGKLAIDAGIEESGVRVAVHGGLSVDDLALDAEGRHLTVASTRVRVNDLQASPRKSGELGIRADLASIEIDGLGFRDDTVDPVAIVELRELRVKADAPRWPERDLAVDIEFRGLGEFEGTANSRLVSGNGPSELEISALPLGPLSGYAREGGFLLKAGQASLDGKVESEGTRHSAKLDLALDGLEIETIDAGVFEELFGMSPDLALAVLKDPTGGVRLPLHFDVDTESGETGIAFAQLMAGALRQAITGILTTPLKGLGFVARGVVGERGEMQMEPIRFEPGSDDWNDGEEDYVAALARSLVARPGIAARITGRATEDEARRPERLAEKRAKVVLRALTKAGVDAVALEVGPVAIGESGVLVEFVARPQNGTSSQE
ncbi:MAG: DUF748 domain-containing protein [Deltaproteobacteria bacterium]|nr:DUF748 domain-containing protein [Deltaproteobacteria bacterium]